MTERIRWADDEPGDGITLDGSAGSVGTPGAAAFHIWKTPQVGGGLVLTSELPGQQARRSPGSDLGKLKAEAERWLTEFASSLGAVFPPVSADEIIRWQDVRTGDSVLLDDVMITAERVDICQKPWGDGTTFTAADIYHRLDNGALVSSERHGDRYTAVRRAPVPDEPAKEAGR